ncbi:MAG: adenylosuccinate synthase [Deltaproteobacteria bacterium]|nr:MAG: adenylosuccinate synthase [Pseudomonadota bacterium]PIE66345.1 MAG: adenylosuccinate synthase [Deltaproteobacteria bacterium]
MGNRCVVGAQWGDEGKGKIVDLLARDADVVVRFGGGANAGHTLVIGEKRLVLHLIPSGIVHEGTICVLGPGVVVDPASLVAEIDALRAAGVTVDERNLRIAKRAHVVLPYHQALDGLRESGERALGTTRRGIGPVYEDKAGRRGLRMGDLAHPDRLSRRLRDALSSANERLERGGVEPLDADAILEALTEQSERLLGHLEDVPSLLAEHAAQGRRLLFEGAQGVLLDIDQGTFPYVTSSTTLAGGACAGAGVGPRQLGEVVGVSKAYVTRVGAGPFPTEILGELGDELRQAGAEFGATTGRPRRCGWLDLPALRHAVRVGGVDVLALTKVDVLASFERPSLCTAYRLDGELLTVPPPDHEDLARVEPVFEEMEGWSELVGQEERFEQLPASLLRYIARVEAFVGVPVRIVSYGPARHQTLERAALVGRSPA